jgi:hypothetical protein
MATLEKFSVFTAKRVNELSDEMKGVWIGESASKFKELRASVTNIKIASRFEQQSLINAIASQAERFLPAEIQSASPTDPLGEKRWFSSQLKVSYNPSRPPGKRLSYSYNRIFTPDVDFHPELTH